MGGYSKTEFYYILYILKNCTFIFTILIMHFQVSTNKTHKRRIREVMLIATSLLSRDMRYFDIAKNVALSSDFKIQVGAIAVYQGKVIATSTSSNKTHPLQRKYNSYRDFVHEGLVFDKLHAEIGLIAQINRLNINPKYISVYVYRVCKSREHGIARPCEGCMQALLDSGITHVYYSTDVGFAYEELVNIKYKNDWGKRNARKSFCGRCA